MLRTHLSSTGVEHDLRRVIDFLAQACKYVHEEIIKSNRKLAGTCNTSGEQQLALDVAADKILLEMLRYEQSFEIRDFVSEERDELIHLSHQGGRYSVAIDPLDGSSLVDTNLSIGTIVGIHDGDILSGRSGYESMAAAMYVLYGPLTTLVYTARQGTHEFVQDPAGNFVLSTPSVKMHDYGKIYSPGGLKKDWLPEHRKYVEELEEQGYKLRYSGGFVPDINQLLMKRGGVFHYPALEGHPNGKLRLMFELQPMALILEEAGGAATDGIRPILSIVPEAQDQRSPIYIGSRQEVALAKRYLTGK